MEIKIKALEQNTTEGKIIIHENWICSRILFIAQVWEVWSVITSRKMIKKIYLSQRHSFTCVLTIQIYVTSIPTYSHEYTTKEIQTVQPMTCLVPFSKSYTFFKYMLMKRNYSNQYKNGKSIHHKISRRKSDDALITQCRNHTIASAKLMRQSQILQSVMSSTDAVLYNIFPLWTPPFTPAS